MSLLSGLKLAAQILGLVILIITLVLALRKFTTNNTDHASTQRLPGDDLAGGHSVINSGQDNLQMIAVNVNPV